MHRVLMPALEKRQDLQWVILPGRYRFRVPDLFCDHAQYVVVQKAVGCNCFESGLCKRRLQSVCTETETVGIRGDLREIGEQRFLERNQDATGGRDHDLPADEQESSCASQNIDTRQAVLQRPHDRCHVGLVLPPFRIRAELFDRAGEILDSKRLQTPAVAWRRLYAEWHYSIVIGEIFQ